MSLEVLCRIVGFRRGNYFLTLHLDKWLKKSPQGKLVMKKEVPFEFSGVNLQAAVPTTESALICSTVRASLRNSTLTMAGKDGKWRGSVTEVIPAPIEKVWASLTDFDGLQRRFPEAITHCDTVEGEVNKVGSVRAVVAPLPDGNNVECNERLLHQDDVNHTISYGMEKTNTGWTGYVGHISAKIVDNGQTLVEWGFEVDPVSAITEEEYAAGPNGLFATLLTILKGQLSK